MSQNESLETQPSGSFAGKLGYGALLRRYVASHWPLASVVAVLLGARIALQLASPQALRAYVDTALSHAPFEALLPSVLAFGGAALAQQAVSVGTIYATEWLGWTATNALRFDLALHCLRLDLGFHFARTPGVLIERVDGDVRRLAGFFSQFVADIAGSVLLLLGILVMLWLEDWRYGLAFLTTSACGVAAYATVVRIPPRYWAEERRATAALMGFLEERLAGAEDIRGNGAVPYVLRRLTPHLRALLEHSRRAWVMSLTLNVAWQTYRGLLFASGFAVGWWLHTRGEASLGTIYLASWYFGLAIWPVMSITEKLEDFQKASASVARIRVLLSSRSSLIAPERPRALPDGPLGVSFRDVSFRYPTTAADGAAGVLTATVALDGVSFHLEPGQVLGLLGRTGSGKSTIGRLLFRFYDVQGGSVEVGGVDVRHADPAALRARVALVTQEVQLFNATLRENLTFFASGISDGDITQALRALGMEDWLRELPRGLDTMLASGGSASGASGDAGADDGDTEIGLSAGEAQLVAFARVFLRKPDLVILDEASSRLDPATERRLDRALDRLLADTTGIVIAHRLGTVRRADRLLILERGRVLESGSREALAADPSSRFSRLLAAGAGMHAGSDETHELPEQTKLREVLA
jgi:ATP-binding cassette, subfamily B, bacterial